LAVLTAAHVSIGKLKIKLANLKISHSIQIVGVIVSSNETFHVLTRKL